MIALWLRKYPLVVPYSVVFWETTSFGNYRLVFRPDIQQWLKENKAHRYIIDFRFKTQPTGYVTLDWEYVVCFSSKRAMTLYALRWPTGQAEN